MQPILERCAGLDVHDAVIVACAAIGAADRRPEKFHREFPAHRKGLFALRDWLLSLGCTHVLMEGTGIYWLPVYAALEGALQLVVGNAHHLKNVPGRKTDMKDAEWLAELLRLGLVRPSFVPPKPIRELRILTRYRAKLVQARSSERNRLLKLLAAAGIKLSSVATDVFGVSGMLMLNALAEGTKTVDEIAQLARGLLRRKIPQLTLVLEGLLDSHHRGTLASHLTLLARYDERVAAVEAAIALKLSPYQAEVDLLCTIPGVDVRAAATVLAEIGPDMSHWPSSDAISFWAGVCPGNRESAGKRSSGRTTQGNRYLKTALVEAAHGAAHTKHGYLREKYYRLKARQGAGKAAMAIAHKILVAAYHMLRDGQPYRDLGDAFLDRLHETRTAQQLVRRLERLGYSVTIEHSTPSAPAAA